MSKKGIFHSELSFDCVFFTKYFVSHFFCCKYIFLFCELNSFVYDQIESRIAFFLERSGRPGHVGSDRKLLKGY